MVDAISLEELGWREPFIASFAARGKSGEIPARVVEEQRGAYMALCDLGQLTVSISGKLRHGAQRREHFPAVGDWVALKARPEEGTGTLQAILPRKSKLSRKASGQESDEQLIAANLDTVFIVTSLNKDLNLRRLERYLAMVSECGATPVVILSKADLCADPKLLQAEFQAAVRGVPVLSISAVSGDGLEALAPFLKRGETVAVIGSSGVGKSTLINRLLGWERQTVQEARAGDDRGRHTTTSRQLVALPQGGLLIDTPGMRELQLWDPEGITDIFADVTALIAACRFGNCRHHTDAGCAVQAAIQEGRLPVARYEHYMKLQKESGDLASRREAEAGMKANEKIQKARAAYKREPKT